MKHINILKRNNVNIEGNFASDITIIFAHGFGADQTSWKYIKEAFSEDYKVVLYDNVGAGSADLEAYSGTRYQHLQGYAEDLIQISKSLNLENAFFVGHSVSSMIGLLASLKNPSLFSKLVLIGASPRYLNDGDYTGGFDQEELDELYSNMTSNYYEWAGGFSRLLIRNDNNPLLSKEFTHSLLSLRPDIALSVAKSIFQSDFRHILKDVTKEVLLLQTKNDLAVPEKVARYLNANIRGSKLIEIDTEGHFPQLSAPDEIIKAIKGFIEGEADVRNRLAEVNC